MREREKGGKNTNKQRLALKDEKLAEERRREEEEMRKEAGGKATYITGWRDGLDVREGAGWKGARRAAVGGRRARPVPLARRYHFDMEDFSVVSLSFFFTEYFLPSVLIAPLSKTRIAAPNSAMRCTACRSAHEQRQTWWGGNQKRKKTMREEEEERQENT